MSTGAKAGEHVAASGVAPVLSKWWLGRGATGSNAAELATHVVDEIAQLRGLGTKAGKNITELVVDANSKLKSAIQSIEKEISQHEYELLGHSSAPNADKAIIDSIKNKISAKIKIKDNMRKIFDLSNSGREKEAIKLAETMPEVATEIGDWSASINKAAEHAGEIVRAKSTNLNSDVNFIREIIQLKREAKAGSPEKLEIWMANPNNHEKYMSLLKSDKVNEILNDKNNLTLLQKIFGVTLKDYAKRIGIPATAGSVATVGAAYSVYDWFNTNDPDETAVEGTKTAATIDNLKVYGPASAIVSSVKSSISTITSLSSNVSSALTTDDPSVAIQKFVTGVYKELTNIQDNLKKWNVIVANSEDQQQAKDVGAQLAIYATAISKSLEQLGVELGTIGVAAPVQQPVTQDAKNISKVQDFFKVKNTGVLDQPTIAALIKAEEELNLRADTNDFSGFFVVPETGYVAPYDTIISAYQKIQKY